MPAERATLNDCEEAGPAWAKLVPPRPFMDAIVVRVAILWLFLHGVASVGSASAAGASSATPAGSLITASILIPATVFVMRVEMARRSELIFLANLGFSYRRIGIFIVVECLVFEVVSRLVLV